MERLHHSLRAVFARFKLFEKVTILPGLVEVAIGSNLRSTFSRVPPLLFDCASTFSLRFLSTEPSEPQLSGKIYKISCPLKEGISTENAKKIAKFLRDEGPKSVKSQIQGDELRVTSKSRDDLQDAIAMIKDGKWDFAVQFVNFR